VLSATSLAQGTSLPAFDLTERGDVASVRISAFSAGRTPAAAAEQMAAAAEQAVRVRTRASEPQRC